jgi:hypothetical protein
MRAAVAGLLAAVLLASVADPEAEAHTLTLARAAARAAAYANDLSLRTAPTQDRGSGVTRCRRVNGHVVDCGVFTLTRSEPPLATTFRCDSAVRVYYATNRSSLPLTRPVGLFRCYEV